ncbi:MAG: RNA methyltransferase [Armatimonadetes bacterium]|nr:RNA methyltransferase [Armatimonadota bacterium]
MARHPARTPSGANKTNRAPSPPNKTSPDSKKRTGGTVPAPRGSSGSGEPASRRPPTRRDGGAPPSAERRGGAAPREKSHFPPTITEYPFFATVVPGLEALAEEELRSQDRKVSAGPGMPGLLPFDTRLSAEDLLDLRCVEDVYATLSLVKPLLSDASGVHQVFRAAFRSPLWDDALEMHRLLQPAKKRRLTYRVVAQLSGNHAYRRVDLRSAVEDAVEQHSNGMWERVPENAALEVWVRADRAMAAIGVRLSGSEMRHRTYQEVLLPGSVKPTVAAAMVLLTRPSPDDVFLDPMCWNGTVLIERALAGRYALLLGGDSDPDALDATRANVGPRHQPIRIETMSARRLPLETAYVDKIATALPLGRQVDDPDELPDFYRAAFLEFARVTKPGGRAVLLADVQGRWKDSLRRMPEWNLRQTHRIELQGQRPTILALDRTDAEPTSNAPGKGTKRP